MKLEDIDQLFKDNERQFDQMPGEQLWARLEQRLAEQPVAPLGEAGEKLPQKQFRLSGFWRYAAAAALILVVLSPVVLYLLGVSQKKDDQMAVKMVSEQVVNENRLESAEQTTSAPPESTAISYSRADTETKSSNSNRQVMPAAPMPKSVATTEGEYDDVLAEKKVTTVKPGFSETKQRAYQPPPNISYAEPDVAASQSPPQPGRALAKENADESGAYSQRQENLSQSVISVPSATPPLADPVYSRYYLGIASALGQNAVQNLPKGYNATGIYEPPVTNNSGKPYITPADAERDKAAETAPASKKKQNAKLAAPAAGSKEEAPAPITLNSLAWLWGTWVSTANNATVTEKWQPNGTAVISSTVNNNTIFSETATLKTLGYRLVYTINNPQTRAPETYRLTENSTAYILIFESIAATTYPNTITYSLEAANSLRVTFTGIDTNGLLIQNTLQYHKE